MVLVGDGGPEQRHDAVAGVLVDRALEAVHALGEELQEAVPDPVPFLRVELLGEIHRPLHVGEQDGYLLALPLQRSARGEDFFRQVTRGVGQGVGVTALGVRGWP
jgi:hypothetical protein